jgi:hypothetical protein
MNDEIILRGLAEQYLNIAIDPMNGENLKLHTAVNDNRMIRPVVLIDELPWSELNCDGELTLHCGDAFLREIEWQMRCTLYKFRHLRADMIVRPYLSVEKVIHSTGFGFDVDEDTISKNKDNDIVSHTYHDQLSSEDELEKFHNSVITYDREETLRRYNLLGSMVGDIIPVRITGVDYAFSVTWDTIATLRGVTNLLIDLVDRPEFMHSIVQRLTDITIDTYRQYEKLDLFDPDPHSLHCTSIATSDLPRKDHKTMRDVWGRGTAQIFATVSKKMHDEFDIEYMKKTMGQCGLVYYGCCEPLDKKIDIVEKIPNLRKISITPWANVDVASEAIAGRYVIASKPNPSSVAVGKLNKDALSQDIKRTIDACRRNGCSCDIVLKDISTCGNRPSNIFEWEKTVMEIVKNY